jgi:hypothetical protein
MYICADSQIACDHADCAAKSSGASYDFERGLQAKSVGSVAGQALSAALTDAPSSREQRLAASGRAGSCRGKQ